MMERRDFLRLLTYGYLGFGCRGAIVDASSRDESFLQLGQPWGTRVSPYGQWVSRFGLPAFAYDADQDSMPEAEWDPMTGPRTRRHWLMVGNRAIRLWSANDGTVGLFDEGYGLRWIVAPEPEGSGVSVLQDGGKRWSSRYAERAGAAPSVRVFGPTWFQVSDAYEGLTLERTVLCPEGESPWLLVRVHLALHRASKVRRPLRHVEQWTLRPRFLQVKQTPAQARSRAALAVRYDVTHCDRGLLARELFADPNGSGPAAEAAKFLFGAPAEIVLEPLGATEGRASFRLAEGEAHPTLEIESALELTPGESRELWFRFGLRDERPAPEPHVLAAQSLASLRARLPVASVDDAPEAAHEIPWHTALLTGSLACDRVLGGHTLNQGSAYAYLFGFNGAARDPLQHALPLVYIEPDTALSVLRNTVAWAKPDGDLPYALNGAKRPTNLLWRPSDLNLWVLWLAAEYAAATGDLAAFDEPLAYHPVYGAGAVPLREHLRRQFRFFIDSVGRGERKHVRILNADWNDVALDAAGVDRDAMIAHGSSVLNSAFASWVLGVFAALAERLGEGALAAEACEQSEELRRLVAAAWNGRWFHRAYGPGGAIVGETDCWLEVQPWAILCGAADAQQARSLLELIDQGHREGSPLGARLKWPDNSDADWGQGTKGGVWYAINMTLIWAATRVAPSLARDEWRRMSLRSHTANYPDIWEGTLSGPDAWNAPEFPRPGRTWATAKFAMQPFPVNNLHAHGQPLLAYLRLLGIEPTSRGSLLLGKAASGAGTFASRVLRIDGDGHGRLRTNGEVTLETRHGIVHGGPGIVRF
ncbi:hypothetical protein LZC95_03500 [Pendulispora brunnea]|uniref:Glycosyl hydrolase 94 catalytic domain-containing protein n=1 Tax=Pendulispora brunnea TaxID=2905690 RepID=A0ABZ2KF11_9BACT